MSITPTILIVEDDESFNALLTTVLKEEGFQVFGAHTGAEAVSLCDQVQPDLMLLDMQLPDMSGIDVLTTTREWPEAPHILVLTGHASIETAIQSMKLGAADYLTKPINIEELILAIKKNLRHLQLVREAEFLREVDRKKYKFHYLVGNSERMSEVYRLALSSARSDSSTVLIEGESGTGKEFLARFIHNRSDRQNESFVEINCAAIPENLIETELFGYEPGAFTDAKVRKKGQIEFAAGGTLFLDEIGELSSQLQAKLLRFLDTMTYKRVGGTRDISMDVRVIAATNRNLQLAVEQGSFRSDLYFRLKVMHITLPSLRERPEDIELFAAAFLEESAKRLKKQVKGFGDGVIERLMAYGWPGNIRELKNIIESTVIVCEGTTVTLRDLALKVPAEDGRSKLVPAEIPDSGVDYRSIIDTVSRNLIETALARAGGNRSRAAQLLSIPRQVLMYQMKKLDIESQM
ncbi:MAG: sigma-54-dependent Fis family transcriptional regulator [Deltaproteobacteria bacterium]|nr:sigma-54-dependent Fis family transcriptional regulator [Candidatus Zymogenaceae bacterium]